MTILLISLLVVVLVSLRVVVRTRRRSTRGDIEFVCSRYDIEN